MFPNKFNQPGTQTWLQDSLQRKKDQLERALKKVTKLRSVEPQRTDLKYEAVALKEGIRMLNEHLRNSQRYADYCESMRRPSQEGGMYGSTRGASFDAQQPESNFVNPMFSSQQAFNSGYMIDPVKLKDGALSLLTRLGRPLLVVFLRNPDLLRDCLFHINEKPSDSREFRHLTHKAQSLSPDIAGSPSSSDEECHNPRHKELELYLMSTGGTIRPSLLKFPESATNTNPGFPSGHVLRSRAGSPLGRQEIDGEGRSINMSPRLQREMGSSIEPVTSSANRVQTTPDGARYVQPRPGMSQTRQLSSNEMPNISYISSPSSPNFSPSDSNFNPGPPSGDTTYRGSQPRVSP